MGNKSNKNIKYKNSADSQTKFQRFDDLASKLFRVPVEEIRELEAKKKAEE